LQIAKSKHDLRKKNRIHHLSMTHLIFKSLEIS